MKAHSLKLLIAMALLLVTGCKEKNDDRSQGGVFPAPEEVKAYVKAISKGMTTVPVDKVSNSLIGKLCVIVVITPQGGMTPPPPPLGMVRIMGSTTVYSAKLVDVSENFLAFESTYPSGGRVKRIEVPLQDIETFAVEK